MEVKDPGDKFTFELPQSETVRKPEPFAKNLQKDQELLKGIFDRDNVKVSEEEPAGVLQELVSKPVKRKRVKKRRRVNGALWRSEGMVDENANQDSTQPICNGCSSGDLKVSPKRSASEVASNPAANPDVTRLIQPASKIQKVNASDDVKSSSKSENQKIDTSPVSNQKAFANELPASSVTPAPTKPPDMSQTPKISSPSSFWNVLVNKEQRIYQMSSRSGQLTSKSRALDFMPDFRSSLRLYLFPDGYARECRGPDGYPTTAGLKSAQQREHMLMKKDSTSPRAPKNNIPLPSTIPTRTTLPRYSYDRSSQEFLESFELGVIPPREEMPENADWCFYEGCLIADVHDYRLERSVRRCRMLLRPDFCSIVNDIDMLSEGLDFRTALKVEQGIMKAMRPLDDLDVRLESLRSHRSTSLSSPVSPMNLLKLPHKRGSQIRTALPEIATSNASLMLVAAAERYKRIVKEREEAVKVLKRLAARNMQDIDHTLAMPDPSVPSKEIMDILTLEDAAPRRTRAQNKIRACSLMHAGRREKAKLEEAREYLQKTGDRDPLKKAYAELYQMTVKAKSLIYTIHLIEKVDLGCECIIVRKVQGERANHVLRIACGTKREANLFLDQFQRLIEKEGYSSLDYRTDGTEPTMNRNNTDGGNPAGRGQQQRAGPVRGAVKQAVSQRMNGLPATAPQAAAVPRIQPNNFTQARLQSLQAQQMARAHQAAKQLQAQALQAQRSAQVQQGGIQANTSMPNSTGLPSSGLVPGVASPLVSSGMHAGTAQLSALNQLPNLDTQSTGQAQPNAGLPPKIIQHHSQVSRFKQQRDLQQDKSMNKS